MDARVSMSDQLKADMAPIVLINEFSVEASDGDAFVAAWADDAAFFKCQPGFISAQLHRGVEGSGVFVNYAVWESIRDFRAAFAKPEFQSKIQRYPASTVARPHLFVKVSVPGICLG
jgi:heme-degrading monooxygenase HmoA